MATPALPLEEQLLAWAAQQLQSIEAGADYFYTVDAVWRVTKPKATMLDPSLTTIAMVHPADIVVEGKGTSTCATAIGCTFFVMLARRYDQPAIPSQQTEAKTSVQLKLFADAMQAIHAQRFNGAAVLLQDRDLETEADGWAITQVLFGTDWSQVDRV